MAVNLQNVEDAKIRLINAIVALQTRIRVPSEEDSDADEVARREESRVFVNRVDDDDHEVEPFEGDAHLKAVVELRETWRHGSRYNDGLSDRGLIELINNYAIPDLVQVFRDGDMDYSPFVHEFVSSIQSAVNTLQDTAPDLLENVSDEHKERLIDDGCMNYDGQITPHGVGMLLDAINQQRRRLEQKKARAALEYATANPTPRPRKGRG